MKNVLFRFRDLTEWKISNRGKLFSVSKEEFFLRENHMFFLLRSLKVRDCHLIYVAPANGKRLFQSFPFIWETRATRSLRREKEISIRLKQEEESELRVCRFRISV